MSDPLFVSVYLDHNLKKALDYSVPQELQSQVAVGKRVEIPLRNLTVKGTIAALKSNTQSAGVRPILKILSQYTDLAPEQWKLAEWMSKYYITPLQKVLKCFVPPHIRKEVQQKKQLFVTLKKTHEETIEACRHLRIKSPKQAAALEILLQNTQGLPLSELVQTSSRSIIDSLKKNHFIDIKEVQLDEDLLLNEEFFPSKPKTLNDEQAKTVKTLHNALDSHQFSSHLIYGVTGSGKTEVYLQAIAKALELKKGIILLVPEVALTSQTIERFRARFPDKIAILHHKRSLGEKTSAWQDLKEGKIQLVIGARSAIFCPIQNLGLIIIDEEHDSSYKQTDEMPCYQARDVAVMRAHLEKAVVVLGSATPSIESRFNADVGKYHLHTLTKRATQANLPSISIVDMQPVFERNKGFTHFSDPLLSAIKDRIKNGEQVLLLLNRRGYHRMQICSECRSVAKCPHCDLSLTYHRESNALKCHLCNYTKITPRICSECNAENSLEFKGFGTEHVERSLHAILPGIRTLRMDRDTTQKKHSHEDLFKQFRSHKADVLIGTQMIAKGFHFPAVTLVGILNIDASLTIPDFRSPEHVFQLLIQVAGRAGRSELAGQVILQTFLPKHPLIHLAKTQDTDAFYTSTLEERRLFDYPPFCHLVKLVFFNKNEKQAQELAEKIHGQITKELPPNVQIFPITTAGHPKVKDIFRFQCIIKTPKISLIQNILQKTPLENIKIDIDPINTFF